MYCLSCTYGPLCGRTSAGIVFVPRSRRPTGRFHSQQPLLDHRQTPSWILKVKQFKATKHFLGKMKALCADLCRVLPPVLFGCWLFQPLLTEALAADVICIKGFPLWIFVAVRQGQVATFYRQEHGRVSADQPVLITIPHEHWRVYIYALTGLALKGHALQTLEWGDTHQHALIDPDPLLKVGFQVARLQQDFICSFGSM